MEGDRDDVRFSGDLTDPWVRALLSAMPVGTEILDGPELPGVRPGGDRPGVVVLHRPNLGAAEADRLRAWRAGGNGPRVVLVAGRHVRYHHLMAWSGLVDAVLPEATARETIARHLRPDAPRRRDGGGGQVAIASGQDELARMLGEVLDSAGYATARRRDDPVSGDEPWVVWDVPVLEPGWSDRLAGAAQRRGVVALLGMADRELVAEARRCGAVACLDLPCDPDDLVFVLDRLTSRARDAGPSRSRSRPHGPQGHRPRSLPGGARTGTRRTDAGR
ncbi:hypothetical protein [Tautonia plasticadhaerens]|uniref:Response regulatory domain-containing protein n=1 Tax=Tautonia plasticadhaerens TaxID=2527974 RepID=A0A518GWP7_9BACT|nr:hypothetical protein [Tautonia plasticadhaerens]QDV33018.1 hypothetical protein ElP_08600 [Tautonia plasticadhaerens]